MQDTKISLFKRLWENDMRTILDNFVTANSEY